MFLAGIVYIVTPRYGLSVRILIALLVFFTISGFVTYLINWIGDKPASGSTAVDPKDIAKPKPPKD